MEQDKTTRQWKIHWVLWSWLELNETIYWVILVLILVSGMSRLKGARGGNKEAAPTSRSIFKVILYIRSREPCYDFILERRIRRRCLPWRKKQRARSQEAKFGNQPHTKGKRWRSNEMKQERKLEKKYKHKCFTITRSSFESLWVVVGSMQWLKDENICADIILTFGMNVSLLKIFESFSPISLPPFLNGRSAAVKIDPACLNRNSKQKFIKWIEILNRNS